MNKTLEYYLSLPYRLEIIPDTVDGGYGACYPELPGCVTCADTLEEVIGIRGSGMGSLKEFGVTYKQVELKEDVTEVVSDKKEGEK